MAQKQASPVKKQNIRILKSQFGDIDYHQQDMIFFSEGLFGYEDCHQFIIWENKRFLPFRWLISVENPELMFPVIDPKLVDPDYKPAIDRSVKWNRMFSIVTVGSSIENVTANLRAPVLISDNHTRGRQVILVESDYTICHRVITISNTGSEKRVSADS